MQDFWNGFEKQAGIKDVVKGVSSKAKDAGKAAKTWWNRPGIYSNVRKTTAHGEELAAKAKEHAARAGESGAKAVEHAENTMKNISSASKYIKPAGAVLGGTYVGSKLLEAPARYQQYKYYKNQNAEKRAGEYSQQHVEDMLHAKARQKKKSGFLSSTLKGGTLGALLGAGAGAVLTKGREPEAIHAIGGLGAIGGAGLGGIKGLFNAAHNNKVNKARDTLINQGPDRSERIMAHSPDNFWSRYSKSDIRDLPFER